MQLGCFVFEIPQCLKCLLPSNCSALYTTLTMCSHTIVFIEQWIRTILQHREQWSPPLPQLAAPRLLLCPSLERDQPRHHKPTPPQQLQQGWVTCCPLGPLRPVCPLLPPWCPQSPPQLPSWRCTPPLHPSPAHSPSRCNSSNMEAIRLCPLPQPPSLTSPPSQPPKRRRQLPGPSFTPPSKALCRNMQHQMLCG